MLCAVMLQGIGPNLINDAVQLVILLTLSVTIDPSLHQERELQRKLRVQEDRDAAEEGMLGRDPEGKGYIELNFFNLFWVFFVCSILGLIIEVVYHMVVVDPGVYQDRAGPAFRTVLTDLRRRSGFAHHRAQPVLSCEPRHHLRGICDYRWRVRGVS